MSVLQRRQAVVEWTDAAASRLGRPFRSRVRGLAPTAKCFRRCAATAGLATLGVLPRSAGYYGDSYCSNNALALSLLVNWKDRPMSLSATPLARRSFLGVAAGSMAASGAASWLTPLSQILAQEAEAAPRGRPARSVIVLWLAGGPSQLETFDPHPGTRIAAGSRARKTNVPGIQLGAGFQQLADRMEQVALVRSLTSKEGDHERGTYLVKSGYRPNPTLVHPSLGAVICHQLPGAGVEIPRHVSILPGNWPARGGYLGEALDAFKTGDPAGPVPDVRPRVSEERFARRLEDVDVIDRAFAAGRPRATEQMRHAEAISAAVQMMQSEQLTAFDVSREPLGVRRRYGETPFGRGCLAARRLVEVGVRCVDVTLSGWDTHANNHEFQGANIAVLDPAFAALLDDLAERRLLEHTLVLCGGEFGRTPQLNPLEGRDHWPHGFSFALAGGSIQGGRVLGATDPAGTKKVIQPRPVADLHATVLSALGIDVAVEVTTPAGRPMKLSEGQVIRELLQAG